MLPVPDRYVVAVAGSSEVTVETVLLLPCSVEPDVTLLFVVISVATGVAGTAVGTVILAAVVVRRAISVVSNSMVFFPGINGEEDVTDFTVVE